MNGRGLVCIFIVFIWMTGVAGTGCDTTIHEPLQGEPDGPVSPSCLEATGHSDFAWVRDNVFKVHCSAFTDCHTGFNAAGHMNLTPTRAFDQLVNVDAVAVPGWKRVVPGDPSKSYLLVKLGEIPGPLGQGGTTMPPNNPLLCPEKRAAVRRWIEAGATQDDQAQVPDAGIPDAVTKD